MFTASVDFDVPGASELNKQRTCLTLSGYKYSPNLCAYEGNMEHNPVSVISLLNKLESCLRRLHPPSSEEAAPLAGFYWTFSLRRGITCLSVCVCVFCSAAIGGAVPSLSLPVSFASSSLGLTERCWVFLNKIHFIHRTNNWKIELRVFLHMIWISH